MAIGVPSLFSAGLHRAAARGGVVAAIICLGAMGMAVSLAPPSLAPTVAGVLAAAVMPVLAAIALIDGRAFIIPDPLNALALFIGLVFAATGGGEAASSVGVACARGVAAALAFLALRVGYRRWRGREGLGLGDVKLAGVAGVWLAPVFLALAVELAAVAGLAAFALMACRGRRPLSAGARLPFGLFFAPAIGLALLLQLACLTGVVAAPDGMGATP